MRPLAWWLRASGVVVLANEVGAARAFMTQPWETPAITPLCLIDGSSRKAAQIQGEGTQTQSLHGECQCHIAEEHVGRVILLQLFWENTMGYAHQFPKAFCLGRVGARGIGVQGAAQRHLS